MGSFAYKNKTQQLRLLSRSPSLEDQKVEGRCLGVECWGAARGYGQCLPSFQDPRIRATSAQVGYFIFIYVLSNSKLQKCGRNTDPGSASPFIGSGYQSTIPGGDHFPKTRCYSSEPQGPSMTLTPHWSFFQPSLQYPCLCKPLNSCYLIASFKPMHF